MASWEGILIDPVAYTDVNPVVKYRGQLREEHLTGAKANDVRIV
jgi:hypothetical protein